MDDKVPSPRVVLVCNFQYGPYKNAPFYRRCGKTAAEALECKNPHAGCARKMFEEGTEANG